jgi:hypothetical protein
MSEAKPETAQFALHQLALFSERVRVLAERVAAGQLGFINAIDLAYDAATWSGLIDSVGDDKVQAALAVAFMGVRKHGI